MVVLSFRDLTRLTKLRELAQGLSCRRIMTSAGLGWGTTEVMLHELAVWPAVSIGAAAAALWMPRGRSGCGCCSFGGPTRLTLMQCRCLLNEEELALSMF